MIKNVENTDEIEVVSQLAYKIWNQHYVPIIGQDQVDYMIDKFQSQIAITNQIKNGYEYYLISHNEIAVGYLALVPDNQTKKLMISKIYIDADYRGSGNGKQLLDFTKKVSKEIGFKTIWLTVNKYNSKSINWYQKNGFEITEEVTMDIGNGYFMDDYVLTLDL
ncbi:GNAT family N-acetyltransferase [Urechidicola croceus]|uniref:N-acetyltransferase domain-containing protein n=1 Tax=Urechidicola croceus TaxID=1850246 RepID=A0A1D8P4Z4_9FLAO|nr:GNAT family N-acetyltransferase [Urechidicola croceus]AOW19625.1 hypothetical protein LPB138_02545 [Urechidicola croceus]